MKRWTWGRAAASLLLFFLAAAVFADFLASSLPLAMSRNGELFLLPNLRAPASLRGESIHSLRLSLREGDFLLPPLHPFGPEEVALDVVLLPPHARHPLGTDELGRDVLSRIIHGARSSLFVGLLVVLFYVTLGSVLGGAAGYYGGSTDLVVSRLIEVLMTFPTFFFVLCVLGLTRTVSLWPLVLVLGLTRWTDIARLVRGEVLRVRRQGYAEAARALGASGGRVLFRHLLPNAVSPVLVAATFGVGNAILLESGLSFLGFGVPPPVASWGELLTQAHRYLTYPGAWWLTLFPGLALFLTVFSLNLCGEALRDRLDPRLRQE